MRTEPINHEAPTVHEALGLSAVEVYNTLTSLATFMSVKQGRTQPSQLLEGVCSAMEKDEKTRRAFALMWYMDVLKANGQGFQPSMNGVEITESTTLEEALKLCNGLTADEIKVLFKEFSELRRQGVSAEDILNGIGLGRPDWIKVVEAL